MKPRWQKQRNRALTFIDVLAIIASVIILAAVILPMLAAMKKRDSRLGCISNLKQVNLAFRIWEGDNYNKYPMTVSATNGGAMEWIAAGNVAACFRVMSNELSTPKILICPQDRKHVPSTNWTTDFNNSHISYFLNPDASEAYPQEIMVGDDNLAINGAPVQSGLLLLSPIAGVSWTTARHGRVGNLGFADGSVGEESSAGLQNALILATNGTPIATNRIAIP
jgi:prepilin-type processing-associated H-X9-DG protein